MKTIGSYKYDAEHYDTPWRERDKISQLAREYEKRHRQENI